MARQKERNCCEVSKAENRSLKKQINHLKREVNRLNKRAHLHEDVEDEIRELELEKDVNTNPNVKKDCPDCGNKLDYIDLGIKMLIQCSDRPKCKHRKTELKK